ncbi:MAG TPA: DUF1778 domain-containing protein [Thermoanaerobaculia bacterium]|nr:DUF1778 domain-containing protein [Thermoanaerobaculia bacterium]
MLRPPIETKNTRLELRLTDQEKELFTRAAEQDGRPLSNWVRDRLMKAARQELGETSQQPVSSGRRRKPKTPSP